MKLQHLRLLSVLIFLLDVLGFHFGDGAVALLLGSLDDDGDPADLDAPGDDQDGLVGLELFLDVLDGLVDVHQVLALNRPQLYHLLCHLSYIYLINIQCTF